jgi:hypothetical protein
MELLRVLNQIMATVAYAIEDILNWVTRHAGSLPRPLPFLFSLLLSFIFASIFLIALALLFWGIVYAFRRIWRTLLRK